MHKLLRHYNFLYHAHKIKFSKILISASEEPVSPVSYTHLDVYKRQVNIKRSNVMQSLNLLKSRKI